MKKIIRPCGLHCIKLIDVGVSFGGHQVISNINLHIHCGTLTAIIGRNGAGKSTLIRALAGGIPYEGALEFRTVENGALRNIRIGYVPQSINIDKGIPMSVSDLIASYHSRIPVFLPGKRQEIIEALEVFDSADLADQPVGKLSGGQLQRVLLANAIMGEPDLLLLDEPVSGIDKVGMDIFYEKISYLKEHFDLAVVLVSHDLDYVHKYADKVILLDEGILASGRPSEVYATDEFRSVFGDLRYD